MFNILIKFFIIIILFSATSNAQKLEKVSLQLQWKYQFQFAGFIVAKERGYYKDVGLDVEILEYNNTNTMQELVDGKIDFAINNSIVAYADKKLLDVTLLATYFQRSPLIFITQPDIKTALDLKNRSIEMTKHDIYNSSLSMMLEYFSINPQNTHFIAPSFRLDKFINKEVDALAAFKSNEVFELDKKHIPYNIIDPVEYGFSTNAINLFASHTTVKNRPEMIHKFLLASKKGWEYSLSHIDEVASMIHQKYQTHRSLELFQYEGKITKELMLTNLYDIGEINREFVNKTFKQLVKNKKIDKFQSAKNLIFEHKHKDINEKIKFSKKEKLWMKNNPIISYSEVNWKPLSIIENKKMNGIMGDYMTLIEKRSGLKFELVKADSWPDVLEMFKNDKIDLVPGVGSSPQEFALGSLSDVYAEYPMVIVTGKEYNYIDSLDKLQDKTIAVPKYYTSYNFLKDNFPKIKLITTSNIEEALILVASGKADAFVGHIATSLHYMSLLNLSELKIAGTTSFEFEHRYLLHEKDTILLGILNKIFRSISAYDKEKINAKWVHTTVEKGIDLSLFYWIVVVVVALVLLVLLRQRFLSNHNRELKKLKERMELALSSSNSGIWEWNMQDNTVYLSPQWKEMLGYEDFELISSVDGWKERVHPNDLADVMVTIQENIKNGVQYKEMSYRLIKKDKTTIWILSKSYTEYDENSEPIRIIGTHINITEAKAKELKSMQQAQIIEQIHDSVIATDMEGIITSFNHGSSLLLGYTSQEVIGKHITLLYQKEDYDSLSENIDILKKNNEHHTVVRLVKKSKAIIYADLSLSLLKDEKGNATGLVGYSQDITLRREAEKALLEQKNILKHQAHHDGLTGLPNRTLFTQRLEEGISKASRQNVKMALLFIDLDHFKEINDSLGHGVGDEVLQEVSKRLSMAIRKEDILARLGGDEFTIIIEGLQEGEGASSLAQKIIKLLSEPINIGENPLYVSSSIGISLYPDDGDSPQDLLKYADAAMYKAKDEGRNNFQFYSKEMTALAFERVHMEASLREGIQKEEFVVYYQAQVNGKNDELIGMEALVRWQSQNQGLISPMKFIPLAELTGLIVDIDRLVMKIAMSQFSQWYKEGLNPGILSLNLSIKHLYKSDFIENLVETMKECNFSAQNLELEILESEIMSNPDKAIEILNQIRDMGISLSIDDFGTGYSSLAYLKKLPVKKLKIDQSFVRDLPDDDEDVAITKAVIALAQSLNLNIIAEGVETKEQRDFLVAQGCENIQGYYYSKPVPQDKMRTILEDGFIIHL